MSDKDKGKLPLQKEESEENLDNVSKRLTYNEGIREEQKLNASEIIRRARSRLDALAGTSLSAQRAKKLKEIEDNLDALKNETQDEEDDDDYEVVSSVALVSAPPPPPRDKDSKETKKHPNTYITPFNPKTTQHPMKETRKLNYSKRIFDVEHVQ
eukprot:Nk52_evm1s1007 gene=Nk52_evmTU1s1007